MGAVLVLYIVGVAYVRRQDTLREKEEAREYSAKLELEQKVEQDVKAEQKAEQKNFDKLPIEIKNRIQFGKLIQAAYQSDDRRIGVLATGEHFDTLELSSVLIFEGSHALDQAREILGEDTLKMVKHLKFKRIVIKGSQGYSEEISVE